SASMRVPKRSLTHCNTKRFGAVSLSRPASPAQASGRIQVANCCGVSSRWNVARQAAQAGGGVTICKGDSFFLAPPGDRKSFRRGRPNSLEEKAQRLLWSAF